MLVHSANPAGIVIARVGGARLFRAPSHATWNEARNTTCNATWNATWNATCNKPTFVTMFLRASFPRGKSPFGSEMRCGTGVHAIGRMLKNVEKSGCVAASCWPCRAASVAACVRCRDSRTPGCRQSAHGIRSVLPPSTIVLLLAEWWAGDYNSPNPGRKCGPAGKLPLFAGSAVDTNGG